MYEMCHGNLKTFMYRHGAALPESHKTLSFSELAVYACCVLQQAYTASLLIFNLLSADLLYKHQVGKGDGCHGFDYHRGAEGEAGVVTALDLESVHLTGLEVEGLLGLADA